MYRFLVPKGQKKTILAHQDTATTSSSICGNEVGEMDESSSSAASDGVKSTNTPSQKCSNSVPNDLNRANPYQPVLKSYPWTLFGGRERCFSAAWYQSRPWLEYSVDRDACFCFPCRVFGVAFSENDTFTWGFLPSCLDTRWKKINTWLTLHQVSHKMQSTLPKPSRMKWLKFWHPWFWKKYDTADSAAFCLKSDGTRDRCNTENLSVIIRFVCNGVPEEHLIGLLELQQLDADYITTEILQHLSESGYSADNIMS